MMPANSSQKNGGSADSLNGQPKKQSSFHMSYLWAALFTVAVGAWLLSGQINFEDLSLKEKSVPTDTSDAAKTKKNELFRVRTRTIKAQPRNAVLIIRGRTEADARVEVKAETAGVIEKLPPQKGARIKQGTLLCKIEQGARQANLLEAKAQLAQATSDFEAKNRLAEKGHTAKLSVTEFRAKLDAARAQLKRAELDLERTSIRAPFDGILEEQPAKVGDYLAIASPCATLVSINPLLVIGAVSERDIGQLHIGMEASAKIITGETVKGTITFVSSSSDPQTRTFRIELEIKNPDYTLRDGLTADISIPLRSTPAHLLSPTILALGDDGQIGVRIIENGNTVKFVPVKILEQTNSGIWIGGLPEIATIITVGQEYVTEGQKVLPVEEQRTKSS